MATYTYRCSECGSEQTEKHSMLEEPVIECKACGSKETHRVLHTAPRHTWKEW